MSKNRRYEDACDFLRKNQLRFSRQRMVVISELFFSGADKVHFKINDLIKSIEENHQNINISNASLTNILKGLCNAGHIREVYVNRPYYDIVTTPHFHFYHEDKDRLIDMHDKTKMQCLLENIEAPNGYEMKDVSCVIKVDDAY